MERLFLDWRNHEWGKWRPSSEARRQGQVAIELERLILRDHYTFDEAVRTLLGRGLAKSAEECEVTWARLPRRPRRQRVDEESLTELPAGGTTADRRRIRASRQVGNGPPGAGACHHGAADGRPGASALALLERSRRVADRRDDG